VHGNGTHAIAEFEVRVMAADALAAFALKAHAAIERLRRQRSIEALLRHAVEQVRAITGFDRVMAYRFRHDDSGDVVAEARRDDLKPFLGMRYPASDIPAQARRLYTINTLRLIADIGYTPVPVLGMAGDQQAATVGQACTRPGMVKATYGTGCFAVLNTGSLAVHSNHRLLTTIAYQLAGRRTYALEGSIFVAGAAVQWLRDGLKLIEQSADVEALARDARDGHGVYMVPAFVGLGAPYWDAGARGALLGLTRDTGPAEIAAATLDSVCYQTRDLVEAMRGDGAEIDEVRVDGGMVVNDPLMQRLADTVGTPVQRPKVIETTALGAAFLAGLQAGIWPSLDSLAATWTLDRAFTPSEGAPSRDRRYLGWQNAVKRVRSS
jgi:glycerol kinase